jgi:adenine deaminase
MSEAGTEQVEKLLTEVREAARALGCPLAAPFMTLSFVSLPTVPALGITDHGLIDVEKHRVVPLFLS